MISAAGWITSLVDGLYRDLVAKGASPEEIHSLVTNGGVLPISKVGDALMEIVHLTRGTAEHVIDCDAPVFVPDGWEVLSDSEQLPSRVLDKIVFDPKKISLFLSEKQQTGFVLGHNLRKDLSGKLVLGANVLDYLLAHTEIIPEEWKSKIVFFWGTIYRSSDGYLYVRCLDWDNSPWRWRCDWLANDFSSDSPAALLAS